MRFPDFATRPVEESSEAVAQPGLTAGKVITEQTRKAAEGMEAYAAELAKTQRLRAEAKLGEELTAAEKELDRPYMTKREVVQALGDVPAEYAALLESKGDDEPIATWMVGEALYKRKAEAAMAKARNEVGWDSREVRDFGHRANKVVAGRAADLRGKYLREQHDYQVASQLSVFQSKLDNSRTGVDFEGVREDIRSSRVLDMAQKEEMLTKVGQREDTTPIYKALQRGDVLELAKERSALADPEQKRHLTPEQRQSYTQTIDAFLTHAERAAKGPSPEDIAKANTEMKQRELAIFQATFESERRTNPNAVREMLKKETMGKLVARFVPPDLEMTGAGREHLLRVIKEMTDPESYRAKQGADAPMTADQFRVYNELNRIADVDPDAFKRGTFDLSSVDPKLKNVSLYDLRSMGKLSPEHALKFSDLTRSLANSKDPKASKPYQTGMEERRITHALLGGYDIDPTSKSPEVQAKVGFVESVVADAIQKATPPGGELTLDQKTQVAKEAAARVMRRKEGFFGTDVDIPIMASGLDAPAAAAVMRSVDRRTANGKGDRAKYAAEVASHYKEAEKLAAQVPGAGVLDAERVMQLAEALGDVSTSAKLDADVVRWISKHKGEDEAAAWLASEDKAKGPLRATLFLRSKQRR